MEQLMKLKNACEISFTSGSMSGLIMCCYVLRQGTRDWHWLEMGKFISPKVWMLMPWDWTSFDHCFQRSQNGEGEGDNQARVTTT